MSLSKEQVEGIATLARLSIDEKQTEEYASSLSNILQLVEQMESADTDSVAPMAHPQDAVQRLRADNVTEQNQREKYQKIAPSTEAGLYLVPRVIE